MKNYYDILGVDEIATQDEIKKAWRLKARETHPDLHEGDQEKELEFREASEAWDTLSDPHSRKAYDIALGIDAATKCDCGGRKLPVHKMCFQCALKIHVAEQLELRRKKAEEKKARIERERQEWVRSHVSVVTPPIPGGDRPETNQQKLEEEYADYSDPWGYTDEFRVPSSDDLLQALLSEAAIRNLSSRVRPQDLDVRFTVGPNGKIKVGGDTVDTLKDIRSNLRQGNKLLRSVRKFLGWSK